MSNKIPYKQDLPPNGGYARLQIGRIPTWTPKPWMLVGAALAFLPLAYLRQKYVSHKIYLQQLADDEGRTCLEPLLKAESDRLLLWQLRRNRDEENKLMKNVPGWETGTWFGEPVYKTNKNFDTWVDPEVTELYAHIRPRDLRSFIFNNQDQF